MPDDPQLWNVPTLAAFLDKPKSWVYDNYETVFAGCYVRLGQQIRFVPEAIRAWVDGQNGTSKSG